MNKIKAYAAAAVVTVLAFLGGAFFMAPQYDGAIKRQREAQAMCAQFVAAADDLIETSAEQGPLMKTALDAALARDAAMIWAVNDRIEELAVRVRAARAEYDRLAPYCQGS